MLKEVNDASKLKKNDQNYQKALKINTTVLQGQNNDILNTIEKFSPNYKAN